MQRVGGVFERLVKSEQSGAVLLAVCTVLALVLANGAAGPDWVRFWHLPLGALSLESWVNDALMAVFFLLVGLELRRELREGELASRDRALLPVIAAVGGMAVPALLHFALNSGTPTVRGFGIPMATDIAFALGMLGLLGRRIPAPLRVFVVAFAVIDDLGAILVIALFYSDSLSWPHLAAALALWGMLATLGRVRPSTSLWPFLLLGVLLWWLMLRSGIHATLAGVLLAFAVPVTALNRLEHALSRPVAFGILPLFALANAGIVLSGGMAALAGENSMGILAGLVLGKPIGIGLACLLAARLAGLRLPDGIGWTHVLGAGLLGGIGFTMSIFIANLAFAADPALINQSKLAVLCASVTSAVLGAAWLVATTRAPTARR